MCRAPNTVRVLSLATLLLAGAGLALGLVASRADAHGSTQQPPSRVFTCRFENPDNPMCADAWSANSQALYDWMEVNIGDAGGRHRELIPDGQLCSAGRSKYAAFDRPGSWPVTALRTDGSSTVELRYQNTAPHATQYYRVYITRSGFDARTDSLAWDDLELVHDTGPMGRESLTSMRAALPERTVPAVLYIVWQRSDSPEAFYACSDVTVDAGSTVPPTTTSPPPLPTTVSSTAPTTASSAPQSTAAPTSSAPAPTVTVSSTAAPVDPSPSAPPTTIASSSTVARSPTAPTTAAPSTAPSRVATVEDEVPSTIAAGATTPSTASASTGGTTTGSADAGSAVPAPAGPGSSSTVLEGATVRADATGPSVASGPAEGGAGVTSDGDLALSGAARTGAGIGADNDRNRMVLGLGVLASIALVLLGLAIHWSGGARRLTDAALRWAG